MTKETLRPGRKALFTGVEKHRHTNEISAGDDRDYDIERLIFALESAGTEISGREIASGVRNENLQKLETALNQVIARLCTQYESEYSETLRIQEDREREIRSLRSEIDLLNAALQAVTIRSEAFFSGDVEPEKGPEEETDAAVMEAVEAAVQLLRAELARSEEQKSELEKQALTIREDLNKEIFTLKNNIRDLQTELEAERIRDEEFTAHRKNTTTPRQYEESDNEVMEALEGAIQLLRAELARAQIRTAELELTAEQADADLRARLADRDSAIAELQRMPTKEKELTARITDAEEEKALLETRINDLQEETDRMNTLMVVVDQSFHIRDANPAYAGLTGVPREQLLRKNLRDFRVVAQTGRDASTVLKEKTRCFGEVTVTLPSGTYTLEQYAIPLMDNRHQVDRVAIIYNDITRTRDETKKLERKVQENEIRRLRAETIVRENPLPILYADTNFRIIHSNPAYCAMSGYSEQKLLKMNGSLFKIQTSEAHFCVQNTQWRFG